MPTIVCQDLAEFGLRLITAEDASFQPIVENIKSRAFQPVPDARLDRAAVLLNESGKTVIVLGHIWDISARLFGFGQIALDHNFSQGLTLQQLYGGGLGWTVVKTGTQEFDVKGSVDYIHQNFQVSASNQSQVGSMFAEIYTRKLAHGLVFNEQISVLPAWNNSRAYSATGLASLSLPVHKRFSLAISSLDTFLNDPPPGSRRTHSSSPLA